MDWIKGFVLDCQARGLTPHVIETYTSQVKTFLKANDSPLDVNQENLRSFLAELRARDLQGSTLKGYFAAISTFYDYLQFEGIAVKNPIPSFRKRYLRIKEQYNGENRRQLISIEQMSELIRTAPLLTGTIMLFLAKTGIRRGELIAMDIQDLNLERGEFIIKPKAKRSNRLGFLDPELSAALREYLDWREERALSSALWVTERGHRVSRNYVYYAVVDHAKLAGLHSPEGPLCKKFTPHCFRHFFTTMLRRAGMPREMIKELRGDRRREAVDIYDHIDPEEMRESYLRCIPVLRLRLKTHKPGTLENFFE